MRRSGGKCGVAALAAILLALLCGGGRALGQDSAAAGETGDEWPWYVAPSLGFIDFEGNEEFYDSVVGSVVVGYDFNEMWSFEAGLNLAPALIGRPQPARERFPNSYAVGLAGDGLFHFTRWDRVDPYLAAGLGFLHYGEPLYFGKQDEWLMRGGGGVMYHINDEWALRADGRGMLRGFGSDSKATAVYSAGVVWYWGARVPQSLVAVGGPLDSDGDGLTDEREAAIGTDPFDPDTDKDRLSDGQEVLEYNTNPLDPDTDIDMLRDGDEVYDYSTDPLVRDTDHGGVADGHEVIEDKTNPLDPKDDLYLIELYIQFDYDKSVIKPQFFPDLDIVAKVIERNPGSTARIEGHADKLKTSLAPYNLALSKRRARAVLEYLVAQRGIARSRLESEGYGFSRPKEPNDPVKGNPANRRVEVYIKGVDMANLPEGAPPHPSMR